MIIEYLGFRVEGGGGEVIQAPPDQSLKVAALPL